MPGPPIPPSPIATDRLDLTPLRIEDVDEMLAVLADPGLYGFIGGGPPSRVDLIRRYAVQATGRSPDGTETWRNWIVRDRPSGRAAGFVQATIDASGRAAEVAWLVGLPWQGRGYAAEAARGLVAWLEANGVATITACVHPDHAASAAVAGRAGLVATARSVDGEVVWERRTEAAPAGRARSPALTPAISSGRPRR
jgi:RimJ/RimL family protein N-acetyltransferase